MEDLRLTEEIRNRAEALAKLEAKGITPKVGTTGSSVWYYCHAGLGSVEQTAEEANKKIESNNERYKKKIADELNAPIIAERDEKIKSIKEIVHKNTDKIIDARIRRNVETLKTPMRESSLKKIQEIKMLIDLGAKIPEENWKAWGEIFAGHPNEELAFATLAEKAGVHIVRFADITKSNERLEQFRGMAHYATDHMEDAENNITAMSFFADNPTSPVAKLIEQIDSDISSIIPAERKTVITRLKEARKKAEDNHDFSTSARIDIFLDRHVKELSTPEDTQDAVFEQAEELIAKGMESKKG